MSSEKTQQAKNAINGARELFTKIVQAYQEIGCPDTVNIRLEELANNFALEIDECKRSVNDTVEYEQEVSLNSYITADMQEVIANIRGCLGCTSKS